jgi:hypothetical protein
MFERIYAVLLLLKDGLMDRHEAAMRAVQHLALSVNCLSCEDALLHPPRSSVHSSRPVSPGTKVARAFLEGIQFALHKQPGCAHVGISAAA